MMKYRYREPKRLPQARRSSVLYLQLAPSHMAMFRFLLEAYDSPHDENYVHEILASMQSKVPFNVLRIFDEDLNCCGSKEH